LIFSILEAKNYHILGSMKINHGSKNNELSDTLVTFLKHQPCPYQAHIAVCRGPVQGKNSVLQPLVNRF